MAELIKVYDHTDHLNNVITALSTDVSEVIYFTHDRPFKRQAQALEDLLKKNGISHKIVRLEDDDYIDTVLDEHPNAYIDISSSRYLSYLLFEKALGHNGTILYYDQHENTIKDYRRHSLFTDKIYTLSIREMIELSGGTLTTTMHETPDMSDTDYISKIKKIMMTVIEDYSAFTSLMAKVTQTLKGRTSATIDDKTASAMKTNKYYDLLKDLDVLSVKGEHLEADERFRQLLTNVGSWLESYLYISIKESGDFDDSVMSATIDFGDREDIYPVVCEIDAIVAKDDRTGFISCKSNKVDTMTLNEIKVHRYMFGSTFSKACVMTADDLNINNPPIFEKAKELDVAVIDKTAIVNDAVALVMKKILAGTYTYERTR